jgi:hypothetical protein
MRLRPPGESELPFLKRRAYGLDVVAWIGEERVLGRKSEPEIHASLSQEYGISISPRHVANLFQVYLALVHCVDADGAPLRELLRKQGRISLSIDGVYFDDTSRPLYVVRDTISGRVLYSERVPKKDAEHLRPLLRKVKELGLPIVGVVSDKEAAQVLAVERELPGVPHQYCQTHFLKNAGKPMESDLAMLGQAVQNAVTDIKGVERELLAAKEGQQLTGSVKAEMEVALKLCRAARTGGKVSGDSILQPTALKRFERVEKVYRATVEAVESKPKQKSGKQKKTATPLMAVLAVLSAMHAEAALAQRLAKQVQMIRKVAHILNFTAEGSQIKRMLATYLNQLLRQAASLKSASPLGEFIRQLDALADRYWSGLFPCYDVPDLPRNNNGMEQQFSRFKRVDRRATGRKSTAGGPLETCAEFLLEAWDAVLTTPNLKELLSEVTDDQLQDAMDKIAELSEEARTKRSIQRDLDGFLSEALEAWKKS